MACTFDEFGDALEKLKWTEQAPTPKIREDTEVLVKVLASPVCPSDLGQVAGWYPVSIFPARTGAEAVGKVIEVGKAVKDISVGQRVHFFVLYKRNAWAEYATFDTKTDPYVPIPDDISDIDASQFSMNPFSVVGLLDDLGVKKGEFVIQNAAASGAGRMLIQYAKARGFKTINVVRRDDQVKELLDLGADYVINIEKEDVPAKVKEYTQFFASSLSPYSQGVPYAIDSVGGESGAKLLDSLGSKGKYLIFGVLSGQPIPVQAFTVVFKQAQITGFFLPVWLDKQSPAKLREVHDEWLGFVKSKVIHFGGKTFDAKTQLSDAIKFSRAPGRSEKAILLF